MVAMSSFGPKQADIAVTSPDLCRPYLSLQQPLSSEALGILVIGEPRPSLNPPRITEVRFPAKRLTGNEPLLINAILIQVGDKPVHKYKPATCPSLDIVQTTVIRFAIYRDEHPDDWQVVVDKPLRRLQDLVESLQLCDQATCRCPRWHGGTGQPPSPVVDIWARHYLTEQFRPSKPSQADVFSVLMRVPSSIEKQIVIESGTNGVYAEPRDEDTRQASAKYQVVWLPKQRKGEATLLRQQNDDVVGLARSGDRIGLRVEAINAEKVSKLIRPDEVFISAQGRLQFHIGPLPFGTQKAALTKALKEFGWNAKPLQIVQSGFTAQGIHWSVQANVDPPSLVLHFQHAEAVITKIDIEPPRIRQPPTLIAAKGTIARIQAQTEVRPEQKDILQINDPWAKASSSSIAQSSPQIDVAAIVSQVKKEVLAQVSTTTGSPLTGDVDMKDAQDQVDHRLTTLEKRLDRMQDVTTRQAEETTKSFAALNIKVDNQKSELQKMFDNQMQQIEQLLAKRPRID